MTTSTSRMSFLDCQDIFDKALADGKGVRVLFETEGSANHFIGRMHRFRELDRIDNASSFDLGHPLHGKSVYDQCVVRRPRAEGFASGEVGFWVYVEKMTIENMVIEPLSGIEEPKRLEGPKEAAE
jgi:hypothetical protein